MNIAAFLALTISATLAYSAWLDHREAVAERRATARDLDTIRQQRAALDELHRRVSVAQARRTGHPTVTPIRPIRRTHWVDKREGEQ